MSIHITLEEFLKIDKEQYHPRKQENWIMRNIPKYIDIGYNKL